MQVSNNKVKKLSDSLYQIRNIIMQFSKQTNDVVNAQTCTTLVIDIPCHKIHTSRKFLGSCRFAALGLCHLKQLSSLSNE